MRALQIQQFGDPKDALKFVDLPNSPLREGVRVSIQAAGINPSDILNAKGAFPSTTLPRVIGRDFAGKIIDGLHELIGQEVWGSGADLGFTRDGTHAERINIPEAAVSLKPKNLSAEQAAAILNQLRPLFEAGLLDPPRIAERYPLERFADAYERAQAGIGKVAFCMTVRRSIDRVHRHRPMTSNRNS